MQPDLLTFRARLPRGLSGLGAQGALLVLLAMIALFAVIAPGFFSVSNASLVVRQGAMLAVVTLGATIVISTGGIDLSVGSIMGLGAVAAGLGFVNGLGLIALPVALLAATAAGLANGWLVAFVGMPPFVATLGMMGIARGLALVLSDGRAILGMDPAWTTFLNADFLGLPAPLLLVLLAYAVTYALLAHTGLGVGLLALGGNRTGARLAGLANRRNEMLAYTFAGALAGLAGLLTIGRMDAAHPQAGIGYEFDAIAAAVIGGAPLEGGRASATGALVGAVFITVLRNGLGVLGVGLYVQLLVVGVVVALAFVADHLAGRRGSLEAQTA